MGKDLATFSARVKKHTEKALLLTFRSDAEVWVPRSTIHNDYNENENEHFQYFLIDNWIMKKKESKPEVQTDLAKVSAQVKIYTEKALLLIFKDGSEFWIPRSTIHNDYNENEKDIFQDFLIDTWLLKKNNIDF